MSEEQQVAGAEPDEDTIDTLPGVVHVAAVVVQCLRCVEQGRTGILRAQLKNPEPADLEGVEVHPVACPTCSSELGRPMAIPVIILSGEQVGSFFDEEGEEGEELSEPAFTEADIGSAEANTPGLAELGGDGGS